MEKEFVDFLATLPIPYYINIACDQIENYNDIANKYNVKLEVVNVETEGTEKDVVRATGVSSDVKNFMNTTECKRISVHIKKSIF